MRNIALALGIGLCLLWVIAIDRAATAWLAWLDLAIAAVAIFSAMGRAGQVRRLRGGDFALGGVLIVVSAFALFLGATVWLASWTAAVGLGYVILGAAPHFQRDIERLSRPDRHSHA